MVKYTKYAYLNIHLNTSIGPSVYFNPLIFLQECRAVYLRRQPNVSHKVIVPTDLPLANPKCYVCASGASCFLKCNAQRLLVRDLRDRVLKKALGMVEPDVEIDGKATILITSEEDCMDGEDLLLYSFM